MNVANKYKKLDKKDKKKFRNAYKMLSCPKDCNKCKKSPEKCRIEMRTLIEILMKRTTKKDNKKSNQPSSMII